MATFLQYLFYDLLRLLDSRHGFNHFRHRFLGSLLHNVGSLSGLLSGFRNRSLLGGMNVINFGLRRFLGRQRLRRDTRFLLCGLGLR